MNSGFTLLEVLLALAIFSIIGLTTVKQITLVRNTKDAALAQMEAYNGLRTALSMMKGDISEAFHILYDDLGEETKAAVLQALEAPHTLFDGRKRELVFTSVSHRVFYANLRESEQTEISYFLQNQKGSRYPNLMKRESDKIDGNIFQGGMVYTLLENVTLLEFSYWEDKQERWVDDWNSDGGATRDRFPKAIKITLGVWDEKLKKELKVETAYKIAFPNNESQLAQF